MANFKDLYTKPLTPDETMDALAPLAQTNDAILPQPSLEGTGPLNLPNFANAQADNGVAFVNNLFKNTPAFDPRVVPGTTDIPEELSSHEELKKKLDTYRALKNQKSPDMTENKVPLYQQQSDALKSQQKPATDDLYAQQGISKIIQGLSTMGGGKIDDNADFYNQFRKYQLEKPQQELENKIKQRNFERMTKMDDPMSQESVNFRKALGTLSPELVKLYGKDFDKITANDKDIIFDVIRTKEEIEARKERARIMSQQHLDSRDEKKREFELRMADKQEQDTNKDIQKFQDKTQDTRNILNSINDFESALGKNLNDLDTKGSTLKEGGKPVDLPGASIPGIGRVSFYDSDARKTQSAAANIFNVELKSRSGAAVTDNELKRLRQEFNDGKFNTEAELIDAIKRYKNRTLEVLKQQESGFKPNVVKTYKDRNDTNQLLTNPSLENLTAGKKDDKIDQYAKQYNLSYDAAEKILRARGYK